MAPAATESTGFTARDYELLANAMKCNKEEIDYDDFAKRCGLKNAASGRTAWHTLRKKLEKMIEVSTKASGGGDSGEEEGGEGVKNAKKRKTAVDEEEGEDAAEATAKPTKKKGRKTAAEEEGGEDAAEETAKPTKKKGRKAPASKKAKAVTPKAVDDEEEAAEDEQAVKAEDAEEE